MEQVTTLTVFEFEGHTVRVIAHHGEPWFIGNQVCDVLGIANSRDAVTKLSSHQRDDVGITDAIGRIQQTNIISEGGFYKLAFQSRKPEAERFTNKVVDEILPAIRKTGTYSVRQQQGVTIELETDPDKLELQMQCNRLEWKNLLLQKANFQLKRQLMLPVLPSPSLSSDAGLPDMLLDFLVRNSPQRFTASELRQYGPHRCRTYASAFLTRALGTLTDTGAVQAEWLAGKKAPRFYVEHQQKGSILQLPE